LAEVDGTTIVLNGTTNEIELKEAIAAPTSGTRTFNSNVEVSGDLTVGGVNVMNSISSEVSSRISGDASLASALSSEISRAESAEDSLEVALSTEVSYLIANTDLTAIDSFAEISSELSTQVSDFEAIYFKKASFSGSINGTNAAFTLSASVRVGSETVYLNGLLQEAGVDYTVAGAVVTFGSAPQAGDKVVIYGVYGGGGTTTTTTTVAPTTTTTTTAAPQPLPQYEFVDTMMGMPVNGNQAGFESVVNNLVGGNVVTTVDMNIQELVNTFANNEYFSLVVRDANNTVVHQELLLDKTTNLYSNDPDEYQSYYATGPNVTKTWSSPPYGSGWVYEFTPTSFILSSYPLASGEYKLELTTNLAQTSVDTYVRLIVS
jgi:hypothetical protein